MRHACLLLCTALFLAAGASAQFRDAKQTDTLEALFWQGPTSLDARPDKPMYKKARPVVFQHDQKGDQYVYHLTSVRAVWTPDTLWLLYSCGYENIKISPDADTSAETNQLWEKSDVAEAFIAPNPADIMRYKEFQVSPGGQWVDLHIDRDTKNHDPSWNSGFRSTARIDHGSETWWAEMAIPLKSFGVDIPVPGTRWRANFYRIEHGPPRRLVAWQPTHGPSFHVPQAFGWLAFRK